MTVFALPDLGEGLSEAEIVTWHVSEGDHVITDQPLVSVETDKAVVEIPAPYSGTVSDLLAGEGDIVKIGAPLVEIMTGEAEDSGAIVGRLDETTEQAPVQSSAPAPRVTGKAAPAVRRLAQELGVDLAMISGSGPGGVVLTEDVKAATDDAIGEELHGVRRAMAQAMAKSHASVVPATVTDTADITDWLPGEKPTPRLVRAIAIACAKEPALNAWFDGKHRQLLDTVDLAIAVDTPDGLFTPVLRNIGEIRKIEGHILKLRRAVEARSIELGDMRDATITLSNFGPLGGEFATLVVTPPQVAILGAGKIGDVCLGIDGHPAIRRILPLSLTFDHRVVTGGEAAGFLTAVKTDLELAK